MNDYSLIKSVLSGIYSSSVGYDEAEAINELQKDCKENEIFRKEFLQEITEAFSDSKISWKHLLADYDVVFFDEEDTARKYAKKILLDVIKS